MKQLSNDEIIREVWKNACRIWVKSKKTMHYGFYRTTNHYDLWEFCTVEFGDLFEQYSIAEKDSAGKYVYYGDVIELQISKIVQKWLVCHHCLPGGICGALFKLLNNAEEIVGTVGTSGLVTNGTIVGNILENPELAIDPDLEGLPEVVCLRNIAY